MTFLVLALIGIFANWFLRGGGWKSAFFNNKPPFDIPGEDWWNGALYGLVFAKISGLGWPFGIFAGLCMVAGATPRWGLYIGTMLRQDFRHRPATGVLRMSLRCGFWGLCLAVAALAPSLWVNLPNVDIYAPAVILAGFLAGPIYYGMIKLFEQIPNNSVFNHWTASEMIFGALIWGLLALVS